PRGWSTDQRAKRQVTRLASLDGADFPRSKEKQTSGRAMRQIKGPAVFLAQFLREIEPFHHLSALGPWMAGWGYQGVQIPTWDLRVIDLDQAAASKAYCEDLRGQLAAMGLEPTELAAPLQGQVLAMHPAYERMFAPFYPAGLQENAI